jgi:6-pyruvoyltetrahydropterin/6-carboxytetrahydropterin synthase
VRGEGGSPPSASPVARLAATLPGMLVELMKEYRFEAAHQLPNVAAAHKCSRVHGHSYKVELFVTGPVNPETGWLIDFGVIDDSWAELFARLDHRYLNDVAGLENSTCEHVAGFVWKNMKPRIPELSAVRVWETVDSCCTYRGT